MTASALRPPAGESEDQDYSPSYRAAAIAAALVFVLYLVTLAPSTAMWDTSEYIAAAYTLGLPHPPGNPLFVLLGRFFAILPIAPNVAMRINILAALCSAVAAAMWFLITERVLVGWLRERWQRIVGGSLAALIGATAFTVWAQSVVNEAEPTGCATEIGVGCTLSKATYDRFMYNLNRGQYQKPGLTDRQAPFIAQVEMWWLYFRWQWLRDPLDSHPGLQQMLATLF